MPIPFYKDTGGSVTVTYFLEQTTTFDHPESNPEGKLRKEGVASRLSEGRDGGQGATGVKVFKGDSCPLCQGEKFPSFVPLSILCLGIKIIP